MLPIGVANHRDKGRAARVRVSRSGKRNLRQVLKGLMQGFVPVSDRQDDRSLVGAFPLRTLRIETGLDPHTIRTPRAKAGAPCIESNFGDTFQRLVRNARGITDE